MRRLGVLAVIVLMACGGCTKDDGATPTAPPTTASSAAPVEDEITFASLGIDEWGSADDVRWAERPAPPAGYDQALVDRMAEILEGWAERAALDPAVRGSDDPVAATLTPLPDAVSTYLREVTGSQVSPRLSIVNVFADGVQVLDTRVTSAWRAVAVTPDTGRDYLSLQLQTRTAYQVRRDDGPIRVIGVLRVQGLAASTDTTDDFGSSLGWQEFGAAGCELARQDALTIGGDLADEATELDEFVAFGSDPAYAVPKLDDGERVDKDFAQRCRDGDA